MVRKVKRSSKRQRATPGAQQWQADQEKIRKLRDSPHWQADLERVRLITGKLREIETTAPMPKPRSEKPRPKSRGRRRSLKPEEIERGIRILRSHGKMTVEAACATLHDAGIKGSPSALYRLVIKPAYGSG